MSRKCRVLEKGHCEITQGYSNNHNAVDIVGANYTLDYVVSHSDGKVVFFQDGYGNMKGSTGNTSYGNCVKIDHMNGYYTLYAHMLKGLLVKNGAYVKKGQRIGYMSDSGNAYGGHLHFEVRNKNNEKINPIQYLDSDLPKNINNTLKHKLGDIVKINKVYVSSESANPLTPAITKGKITRIIENARNPYLLENGNIGWINDNCIIDEKTDIRTIKNCYYLNLRTSANYGNNIYSVVPAGTKVEYLGEENGWAKIKYNNKILYCGVKYLR